MSMMDRFTRGSQHNDVVIFARTLFLQQVFQLHVFPGNALMSRSLLICL